jgi:hypothetical protein
MESSLRFRLTEFTGSCPQATHQSLVWKSADAQVTIDSIRQVLDAARTGQPLLTR